MSYDLNLDALHSALISPEAPPLLQATDRRALSVLPKKGIAHDHVRIIGTGWLLRVPRKSQFELNAVDNLAYQAACFDRASQGSHAPHLHAVLPPSKELPMGALVVDEIDGRTVELPGDLPALGECLASIHRLPLPPEADREPLAYHSNPIAGTLVFIEKQAKYLEDATNDVDAISQIREELQWARKFANESADKKQPISLVVSDTHPGNYIVDRVARAFIVDLEKGLYGSPAIDLAHCTLYTSTTWDIAASGILEPIDISEFYKHYLNCVEPTLAKALQPWLMPLRRLTWLRTTTWSAKWRVEKRITARYGSAIPPKAREWSTKANDDRLNAHAEERTLDFLSTKTVERIRSEWLNDDGLKFLM